MPIDADFGKISIIRAQLGNSALFTEGLKEAGDDIVELASQLAPYDSGDLSRSGKSEVIGPNKVEVSFGNDLPDDRAIAQEYGTVTNPAQPYLTPALKEIDILKYIKEALNIV